MFIHSEQLNPCKCGSNKTPDLDSDDMIPCWSVKCYDCGQSQNESSWSMKGAVNKWNKENPIVTSDNKKILSLLQNQKWSELKDELSNCCRYFISIHRNKFKDAPQDIKDIVQDYHDSAIETL